MSMQLGALRTRLSPGQLRRRAARLARRGGKTTTPSAPMPIVVTKPLSRWSWREQRKVEQLATVLSGAYGWRYIQARTLALREHLLKVAEAAGITRCRWKRTKESGECGGKLRRRRAYRGGSEQFCGMCGRVPA